MGQIAVVTLTAEQRDLALWAVQDRLSHAIDEQRRNRRRDDETINQRNRRQQAEADVANLQAAEIALRDCEWRR